MDILRQYNKIGKKYIKDQKEFYNKNKDHARVFIKNNLPKFKGKMVLDVGCGSGSDILIYEKLGAKKVYGIDTSLNMINIARENVKNPEILSVCNIEKTEFKNNSFDVVISRFSLHYLKTFNKVYKEIARILKNGGILIFVAEHPVRDFELKQFKSYESKEIVKYKIYDQKMTLRFWTHTFEEYFSKAFFKHFNILNFKEGEHTSRKISGKITPGFIAIKAIKK